MVITTTIESDKPFYGLVPKGRVTACNTWRDVCGKVNRSTHHVSRIDDERLDPDLSKTKIGLCILTGEPCKQLAELIAAEIPLDAMNDV